jgi:poly-gamma-glutamate synthesis protein (capsule biosynthesis protein)
LIRAAAANLCEDTRRMKKSILSLTLAVVALTATVFSPARAAQAAGPRFFAVAAPFPTVADGLSFDQLKAYWAGDAAALSALSNIGEPPALFLTNDTLAAMKGILGEPKNDLIQTVPVDALLPAAWGARRASFAILPFDQLEQRWKLLHLDGVNLFEKEADVSQYPLTTSGPANRDTDKMTVVAMTGVTALVRGTAVMMERKGVLYPGAAIRDWLRTADITHISNEVSFWDNCPRPTFNDGVVMCSNPKYIELLEDVGTDVIELTGNHLWDRGADKLNGTLDMYDARGWSYFGGGRSAATALAPAKFEINGNKIAFVGCNWFGANWATDTRAGSARCGSRSPRDLDLIIDVIQKTRAEGYLVIAGIQYLELYNYAATPQQHKDFDALRQAGAVIVNGSQGHHAQGFDVDDKGFLHYGVGNLFFGDQAAIGAKQTFVDRHVFLNGRYLGVDLRTAFIQDFSQPVPMRPDARATLLRKLFDVSGY